MLYTLLVPERRLASLAVQDIYPMKHIGGMRGRRNWTGRCFQGRPGANFPEFSEIRKAVEPGCRVRERNPSRAFSRKRGEMQSQQLHWRQGDFGGLGQRVLQRRTDPREIICRRESTRGRGSNCIASTFIEDDIEGRIASQGGHLIPGSQITLLPVHGLICILAFGFSTQTYSLSGKVHVLRRVSRAGRVAAFAVLTTMPLAFHFCATQASRSFNPSFEMPGPKCRTRGLFPLSSRRSNSRITTSRISSPEFSHSPTSRPVVNLVSQNAASS